MVDLVQTLRQEREQLTAEIAEELARTYDWTTPPERRHLARGVVNAFIVALANRRSDSFESFLRSSAEQEARAGSGRQFEALWTAVEKLSELLWQLALAGNTAWEGLSRWERVSEFLRRGREALIRTYVAAREEGDSLGQHGPARDRTEESQVEKAIFTQRQQFQAVFEATGTGLSINDLGYRVQEANRCQRETFHLPEGRLAFCYALYFGREDPCPWCGLDEAVETGQQVTRHNVFNALNDRVYHLSFSPLPDAEGRVVRIMEAMTDVTDRWRVEQQMARTQKFQALGRLAGGITHRLNNALGTILGRTQWLLRQSPDERSQRGLNVILHAAQEAADLVDQVQRFSRPHREDEPRTIVDLNEVVCDALRVTEPRWRDEAQADNVTIEVRTQLAEPDALIEGHHEELVEALTNLLINAVEAMPEGGTITVRTRTEDQRAEGRKQEAASGKPAGLPTASHLLPSVILEVSDTGPGIPPEQQSQIFDPFFTTKGTSARGLGLSVTYSIIERHGGTIDLESRNGQGTTFRLEFPRVVIPASAAETLQDKRTSPSRSILVAEDDPELRELLTDLLESEGHHVLACADGIEAVHQFAAQGCDLVLTDLSMPGQSGWEVVQEIKQLNPNVPVAVVTGWGAEVNAAKAAESGADAVIAKPYDLAEILDLIASLS